MTVVNIDRDSKTEFDDDRSMASSSHRQNHVAPATISEDIDHEREPEDVPPLPPSPNSYLTHHTSEQNLQLQPECSIGGEPGTKCEKQNKQPQPNKQFNIPLYILRIYFNQEYISLSVSTHFTESIPILGRFVLQSFNDDQNLFDISCFK